MKWQLLKMDEVAAVLGVSRWRAYELARLGAFPVVKLGERQLRVDPARLQAWIDHGGAAAPPHTDAA
jgi:excisionase family DNA binding protein